MTDVLAFAGNAALVLADESTKGPEFGKANPIGLLVIIVLLIATFLLMRSMNKQLRKLPESFDTEQPEADQAFDEGTESSAAAAPASAATDVADTDAPAAERKDAPPAGDA